MFSIYEHMFTPEGVRVHQRRAAVEEVLDEHPSIMDSMVVGIPHERWGQLVVAYVVPSDSTLTVADCERHCRQHPMLADYKRPRGHRFVEELPVSATGKKVHYKARRQAASEYERGLFHTVEPTSAVSESGG